MVWAGVRQSVADLAGYTAHLVTLTLSHHRGHNLSYLFDALSAAWSGLASGKAWQKWRSVFCEVPAYTNDFGEWSPGVEQLNTEYVKGLDLTWSLKNGWHPHLHIVIYLPPGHSGDVEWFVQRWINMLAKQGFTALRKAQDVSSAMSSGSESNAEKATEYAEAMNKMLTAEAVSMATKRGRSEGSFSPFEILAKALSGDDFFVRLWKDYVKSTKGRRQTTVSRGFKLKRDEELPLADDVAALGSDAVKELDARNMIQDLMFAAKNEDKDVRRWAVEIVLSRLESTSWRIIGERPPDSDIDDIVSGLEEGWGGGLSDSHEMQVIPEVHDYIPEFPSHSIQPPAGVQGS